jgi:hypothetical protein
MTASLLLDRLVGTGCCTYWSMRRVDVPVGAPVESVELRLSVQRYVPGEPGTGCSGGCELGGARSRAGNIRPVAKSQYQCSPGSLFASWVVRLVATVEGSAGDVGGASAGASGVVTGVPEVVEAPDWRVDSWTPRATTPLEEAAPVLAMRWPSAPM